MPSRDGLDLGPTAPLSGFLPESLLVPIFPELCLSVFVPEDTVEVCLIDVHSPYWGITNDQKICYLLFLQATAGTVAKKAPNFGIATG
jgi:hypothetical protein